MNELYKIAFDTIAHIIKKWNNDEEAEQTDYEYLAEIENCVNAVGELPDNVTNGDVIKAMFPLIEVRREISSTSDNIVVRDDSFLGAINRFHTDWWGAPYKGGQEDGKA